jgi:hypothetical protein
VAHTFEFDTDNKVLLCRLHGRVTDESLRVAYGEVRKWSSTVEARAGIFDLSPITSFDVSTALMLTLAQEEPAMNDGGAGPRVIVAPTAESFGMSRMFQTVGEEKRPRLSVVRTLEEAYAVLEMRAVRFEPLGRTTSG